MIACMYNVHYTGQYQDYHYLFQLEVFLYSAVSLNIMACQWGRYYGFSLGKVLLPCTALKLYIVLRL